jgi:prepilin-type N-terminal cleavage/methylation domain-containing protein
MVRNHHGFTLVELCIAVMIAAILGAVAAPSMTGFLRIYRLNGAARVVWGDLHRARLMAIKENRTIRVDFTSTAYTLVRVDTAEVAFTREMTTSYPGITLTVAPNTLSFVSTGLLNGAQRTVQVQSATGTKSFSVLPTGQIGSIS